MDEEAIAKKIGELEKACGQKVIGISAVSGKNVDQALYKLADIIKIKKSEKNDS
jgi:hypothetical protein